MPSQHWDLRYNLVHTTTAISCIVICHAAMAKGAVVCGLLPLRYASLLHASPEFLLQSLCHRSASAAGRLHDHQDCCWQFLLLCTYQWSCCHCLLVGLQTVACKQCHRWCLLCLLTRKIGKWHIPTLLLPDHSSLAMLLGELTSAAATTAPCCYCCPTRAAVAAAADRRSYADLSSLSCSSHEVVQTHLPLLNNSGQATSSGNYSRRQRTSR